MVLEILALGLLYGLLHALDADHIAAVSTIVSKQKRISAATFTGLSWGIGHTFTLLIVGLLIILFKINIPEKIALSLEFLVGAMIVFLGASVIYNLLSEKKHLHVHTHDGMEHTHIHSHNILKDHKHYHKPFFIGIIHGLAGSAALMLLVLSTIDTLSTGLLYILIFGIGSMIGMSVVGTIISLPFVLTKTFENLNKYLRYAAGTFSIAFGIYIMIQVGTTLFPIVHVF